MNFLANPNTRPLISKAIIHILCHHENANQINGERKPRIFQNGRSPGHGQHVLLRMCSDSNIPHCRQERKTGCSLAFL